MFLRLYWSRMRPGCWDALRERYVELGGAEVPGRLLRWVTQDTNDPESIITVTLWEREADIRAWEESELYARAVAAVRPYLVGSQTVSLCEVKLEHPAGLLAALASGHPRGDDPPKVPTAP